MTKASVADLCRAVLRRKEGYFAGAVYCSLQSQLFYRQNMVSTASGEITDDDLSQERKPSTEQKKAQMLELTDRFEPSYETYVKGFNGK